VRARHPLTRAPSTCDVCVDVSLRSGSVVMCSYVHTNAGLCGPLVSVGNVGTDYHCWLGHNRGCPGIGGTNLDTACPSTAPTSAPTATPPPLPCCEEMRLNPVFCCIEARKPELAWSVCQECGTGQ
jgi:hypothetical protein